MTNGHDPEAAVASLRGQGVRAVRLLYTDLHGVARGKDIPLGHFVELRRGRGRVLRGGDGHRPRATRRSSAARRGTSTSRSGPTSTRCASSRGSRRSPGASARRGRSTAPTTGPSCPRALLARVVARYARARPAARSSGPSSSASSATRDPRRPAGCAATSTSCRACTRSARSPIPRQIKLQDAALRRTSSGSRRSPANHEFMNSQYEINIKHSAALDAADRAFMLKARGQGDRGDARGSWRRSWGARSPTRAGRASTCTCRSRTPTVRNAFACDEARRAEPARPAVRRRRDRARAGAAGAARPDGERVQADPPGQPRADPRELGPRQPHRVLPRPERARLADARRDPHRRRLGVRAPDHRGAPARRASTGSSASSTPPEPVVGDAYRMDDAHAGTKLPGRPRCGARRARGGHLARRAARRRARRRRSSR